MSYEIVKSIVLKDKEQQVWLNSADSSVRPLSFSSWECKGLSEIYQKEGREAVLARIGKDVWDGNLHLYQGNKMCKLFLAAREALPDGLSFMNFDGQAAGKYLAKAVMKLEENPKADLTAEVEALLALRNDRAYILETAKRTGHNYLGFADVREFALEVMRACGDRAWADYPAMYADDKEFAVEMLRLNGCHYRSLSERLKADREVIMEAFAEAEGKNFHEHLPDLIPVEALLSFDGDKLCGIDKGFVCELLEACPSMHMNRTPALLSYRDICLKWCEVGKWFPHSVKDVPEEFLQEQEFQEVLRVRFEGTDKFETLVKILAEKGVALEKSLAEKLAEAKERASGVQGERVREKEKEGLF